LGENDGLEGDCGVGPAFLGDNGGCKSKENLVRKVKKKNENPSSSF
jgi:hypothetical protein